MLSPSSFRRGLGRAALRGYTVRVCCVLLPLHGRWMMVRCIRRNRLVRRPSNLQLGLGEGDFESADLLDPVGHLCNPRPHPPTRSLSTRVTCKPVKVVQCTVLWRILYSKVSESSLFKDPQHVTYTAQNELDQNIQHKMNWSLLCFRR